MNFYLSLKYTCGFNNSSNRNYTKINSTTNIFSYYRPGRNFISIVDISFLYNCGQYFIFEGKNLIYGRMSSGMGHKYFINDSAISCDN